MTNAVAATALTQSQATARRRSPGRGRSADRRRVAAISAISSSLSSKSKSSKFSRIRSGVTDLGMTTLPSCRCQRRIAWAGVLPWRAAIAGDRLVVEQLALGERAPGLGRDAVLGVPGAQLGLLEVRVQLDLVDGRPRVGLAARAARGPRRGSWRRRSCARGPPRGSVRRRARCRAKRSSVGHRPVDQVEVDVVEAEPAEAALEGAQGRLVALLRSSTAWS